MKKATVKKRTPKRTRRRGAGTAGVTIPDCRRFSGYKPCFPNVDCSRGCVEPQPFGTRLLIVNLDAMGNVLVTTSLLPALKRKFPQSHISWITLKNALPLLHNNPYIDKTYVWEAESWLILQQIHFDLVLSVDKSQRSGAFVMGLKAREKLGFGMNDRGQIAPLNNEASYNFSLGLDDHLKFRINRKTVQQIQCEQFKLEHQRDEYVLELDEGEKTFCRQYRSHTGIREGELVVGFNTGCSELYPNKKMTIEQHVALVERLSKIEGLKLVLVGGPEDTERNSEIFRRSTGKLINTPTTEGLRRGLCYEDICDVVVTGDSFGMHAAIGLKKYIIVWFGVSCWTEIDLYERGIKLIPEGLECSPCWKRHCPYNQECVQMVDLDAIVKHILEYRKSHVHSFFSSGRKQLSQPASR